jgi:hypothetical protein
LAHHFPADMVRENAVPESEWHTAKNCVQAAEQSSAPVVWLGGSEPLFHPAIGDVAAALADTGRYVFVHTNGIGLRKRIHEFKPVNRLYLALEIPLDAAVDGHAASPPNASFAAVSESIRVARLSGFHVCAHFTINETVSASRFAECMDALQPQHLDGVVVSSGASLAAQANPAFASKSLTQIVELIPSGGWRNFSRLLEASHQQPAAPVLASQPVSSPSQTADALEESA